jgi:hypothetical protein
MSTLLFSYKTTYKVTTWYTTYELIYGLHPLMPTKNIVPIASGIQRDSTLVKVLTSKVSKFKNLQEARMQVVETIGI